MAHFSDSQNLVNRRAYGADHCEDWGNALSWGLGSMLPLGPEV
jgi:hypothetical protein